MNSQLVRPTNDRMVAGVCSGRARYVEMDVTLLRIIVAVLTFVSFGTTVPLYFILWLVLPNDGAVGDTRATVQSNLLEMKSQAESLLTRTGLRSKQADWKFDPHTGQPIQREEPVQVQKPRFDPYTGQPVDHS